MSQFDDPSTLNVSTSFGTINTDADLQSPAMRVPSSSSIIASAASSDAVGLEGRRKKLKEHEDKKKAEAKGSRSASGSTGGGTGSLRTKEREAEINRIRR